MSDAILALCWVLLAHVSGDFLLQTDALVRAKNGRGWPSIRALLIHGALHALCLVPVGLAWGGPGWLFLGVSALSHVAIDRAKIVTSRRVAATAVAASRPGEAVVQPADHLGRAWTPAPAALFIVDQIGHLGVAVAGWAALLATAPLQAGWISAVDRFLGGWDRAAVHDVMAVGVVLAILAVVNIRAAAIFVAILVRPVEASADDIRWGGRAAAAVDPARPGIAAAEAAAPGRRWAIRVGPLEAHVQAESEASPPVTLAAATSSTLPTRAASVGATIGILERILIVVFVLTGSEAAIGFVVAAKTLARFRLLDDRDFAEYYLLGTLASVAVAIITSLVARAALGALLV